MYENIHVLDVCVINFHWSFANFVKLETILYVSCCMIIKETTIHTHAYVHNYQLPGFKKPGMGLA